MSSSNLKFYVANTFKKTIRDVLIELYSEYGSYKAVARELCVSVATVQRWVEEEGLEVVKVLKPKKATDDA